MALHPIRILDSVFAEYRDYLLTEFRAKDQGLRGALERAIDERLFLAQEPFYQAQRAFRSGKRWAELPIDPRLARVMEARARKHGSVTPEYAFLHQSEAIESLLSPETRPVVVTTGTGSGKTEAFLLPVIQNAVEDATRFKKPGLTAILVYPMNALANDQELRIREYLDAAGFEGTVAVEKYDRGTPQAKREEMRRNPPHILLTNYMMLEYLLVRPADREGIFANHRCRFLVLDEIHTYRGTLGANIALLVRRLRAHLRGARQDWGTEVPEADRSRRFPKLVAIGTSATIKGEEAAGLPPEEARCRRDEAVQAFFARLTGEAPASIRTLGEEVEEVRPPADAVYPLVAVDPGEIDPNSPESVRRAMCRLAGAGEETSTSEAARRCRLLWDLNLWLMRAPQSADEMVERLKRDVPERAGTDNELLRKEVEAALVAGAALPPEVPAALRLRAHRLIRGGWRFHRCLNPACGRLQPMGAEECPSCGFKTAPLFLCRACGADYLRLVGDPEKGPLRPSAVLTDSPEWLLYEPARFDERAGEEDDDEEGNEEEGSAGARTAARVPQRTKGRPYLVGSLDPESLLFSQNEGDFAMKVVLAPARKRCLCCGGTAGSRSILTPVSLGTSAAVKVLGEGLLDALSEANRGRADSDGKERLLIFSDSRQDAAHQARFIVFASRYDRLRRRLVRLLKSEGPLSIQRAVELLGASGVVEKDNPCVPESGGRIPSDTLDRIRAWEEATLLDEISVTAGYRATLLNLGLVGIAYDQLGEEVRDKGAALAAVWGVSIEALEYVARCLLDEMRSRATLSRTMLRYHPVHPSCPEWVKSANWERRISWPAGFAASREGAPVAFLDDSEVPNGIRRLNPWRRPKAGGRGPSLERILRDLLSRFGGREPDDAAMVALLDFLVEGSFLVASELYGARDRRKLLQVNAETVRIGLLTDSNRMRCGLCGSARPYAQGTFPCPQCRGSLVQWLETEVAMNRHVRRIRAEEVVTLHAGEHAAQVPNAVRATLESDFKAPPATSKVNVLACSPTLEMGIDVGGLDAVLLRNVPPRPDNYAQRGGRAGRRSRVGIVLGYARSTPHDQYFYDKPAEMIAGEVVPPALALGNRDVLLRHLNAIVFGAAEPGLAGRMVDYVSPQGVVNREAVDGLINALERRFEDGIRMTREAFGEAVLAEAGLTESDLREQLGRLPDRVRDVIDRTARQVAELRRDLDAYSRELQGQRAGTRAGDLVARLLGIPTERRGRGNQAEADDRSAGYPMRRFAEFGILPGYEFPTLPAALRLKGDANEEEPLTVDRRFGLDQFRPDVQVYARGGRWEVSGLDLSSPWNPSAQGPSWSYRNCGGCGLRFRADQPRCPRCRDDRPGRALPAYEFGGFVARKAETPVLDEEERMQAKSLVRAYPQWDGEIARRWRIGDGIGLRLNRREEVEWLNEGPPPSKDELDQGLCLHPGGRGFLLCPDCGQRLRAPEPVKPGKGRRQPRAGSRASDPFGHAANCTQIGTPPRPLALATTRKCEILRLLVPVGPGAVRADIESWGLSLGYSVRAGMRQFFMLDGPEIEFELEGPWTTRQGDAEIDLVALAFIDPSLGGSGFLWRAAEDLNVVARRTLEYLDHQGCEKACYRCLKSYANQRIHEKLSWPLAVPMLEALATERPMAQRPEVGDIDDPRPWLEAYAIGLGSPLELRFWRLFEQNGFRPEKQVPVAPADGEPPISIADFAIPERRLAIYVDGAAFHVGANLRRDRYIRDRLRAGNPPWRVEELRAADLARYAELVERLKT